MNETKSYNINKDNFYEAIIVGGGTCGLAVCARLCEDCPDSIYTEDEHQRFHWLRQRGSKVNLINRNVSTKTNFKSSRKYGFYWPTKKFKPEELLVLDSVSDSFLGQWDNQFESCQIPFLRSPMFFHPDPANVDALVGFAHFLGRETSKDLMEIKNVVGREYSKHQLKKLANKNSRKMKLRDTNCGLSHDKPGLVDINMRDWKDYYRPSTKLFRDFCQGIINRYQLQDNVRKDEVISIEFCFINIIGSDESGMGFIVKTASDKIFGCKICVVASGHRGEINYPIMPFESNPRFPEGSCHTSHIFGRQVEFPHGRVMQKIQQRKPTAIVIVGGGLTSAQLADVAINLGVDKVYLLLRGPIKIKHFDFHLDWVTKYKNVKKSAFYIKDTDEERYEMIQEAREGGSFNPEYYKKLMNHSKNRKLELLKFATIQDQRWEEESKTWNLTLTTKKGTKNTDEFKDLYEKIHLSNIDYVYFATGIKANIKSLPLLHPILEEHKIDIVHGLPCLTDNLQWNDQVPLFMVGKNASLKIGPSSANLDGARLGAERIGWYIQELKSQGKLDWNNKICNYCASYDSIDSFGDELDSKLDVTDEDSGTDEELISSFETRFKLASGQLNWFALLGQV